MKSFSINRFGKTLRWVLCTNFRNLLMWSIGAALVVFLGEQITWALTDYYDPVTMINDLAAMGTVLFYIVIGIMVSSVVSTINEKRKRGAFLMIPSTSLEKYLALIVYTTVICTLCVFLALVVGDSLRMAWFWGRETFAEIPYAEGVERVFTYSDGRCVYWYSSVIPKMVLDLNPVGDPYRFDALFITMKYVVVFALLLWLHSLYTLGGTLMRKYAFVATSVFFVICVVCYAKFINHFHLFMFKSDWAEEDGTYIPREIGAIVYVMSIVLPLLAIFNYWASFQIFKGFQLITNKWTNYDILKR